MSEEILVTHCSPTLADMKTGNLFNCKCDSECEVKEQIEQWNKVLNPKGVSMTLLRTMKDRALVYVYRPKRLELDMKREEAQCFLRDQGYQNHCTDECIKHLATRLCSCEEFPHEIGLFLGYPIEDVKGFIENKGKNCKCVGYWKVYFDEQEAQRTFEKYRRCTKIYRRKLQEGRSVERLTVSA
ncbi:DUF3793 family protein [Niameybacter massiliensis]|uniref:DUF3793 family protein n=1 Tax=Niameybacter massiliensis TaxID=1658108 RepID=UPI0006B42E21|nr:DUF3793 family protein [Niameybacter massiliensis]